jgi:hypothetical protein
MAITDVVKVPETLAELLTPEWLTAALQRRYPGTAVTRLVPGTVATRISTNAFLEIECAGGSGARPPARLCAKGYFRDTGNWPYRSAGEAEAYFYRDLVDAIGVRTLPVAYADVDPETKHGVVITADIAAEGSTFVDPLQPRSPSEVAGSLEHYAEVHGRTWGSEAVSRVDWLAPRIARTMGARGVDDMQAQFDGPLGRGMPDGVRDAGRLMDSYASLPALTEAAGHWCLIHGDAHIGNLFTDAGGRPGILDWQLVQQGPWYIDVGYHIASSLDPEDRRRSERDLLAHYLDRLSASGVDAPTLEEAWPGYCCGIVYGLFLWSITQKVRPEITGALLARIGTAADDHDAFGVVAAAG